MGKSQLVKVSVGSKFSPLACKPTASGVQHFPRCQGCLSGRACLLLQERVEALRAQLGGRLESAVLNCCAFTSSVAAQQLLESALVKRGHRCARLLAGCVAATGPGAAGLKGNGLSAADASEVPMFP